MRNDDATYLDDDGTQFTCFDGEGTQFDGSQRREDDTDYVALKPGTFFLGKYKILKVLGNGNFGMIYLLEANDASKKLLVLKEFFPKGFVGRGENNRVYIKPKLSENELRQLEFMKKIFIGEAQNLVKATEKHHPNIATFFALEEDKNDTVYFIMNYESGISLKQYVETYEDENKAPISKAQIYAIALPLLSALDHIHRAGVFHQDIKLENILIREDGSPILLDFGASVILFDEHSGRHFNAVTPRYAAVEQIHLDEPPKINQTSDIYATGVLLYRLITGKFPAKSEERLAAISKGKKDPYFPLISQKPSGYDKHLLRAVDRALSLSQEDRFQSAKEFASALKNRKKLLRYFIAAALLIPALIYLAFPTPVGKLKLSVSQKGYTVYVDGNKVIFDRDRTTPLASGEHEIIITKDGFAPFRKKVSITSNALTSLDARLHPVAHEVQIKTNVDSFRLWLNGHALQSHKFMAHYGEKYSLKIQAKDHETLERKLDYTMLFQNDFTLYFQLPVSKILATIDAETPLEMGITKIFVNHEPLRGKQFMAKRGGRYDFEITNPYFLPLKFSRTFQELKENPRISTSLQRGKGHISVSVHPSGAKIMAYHIVNGDEVPLMEKPLRVEEKAAITLPAADKVFFQITKEGYAPIRSRMFPLRQGEHIGKAFTLQKPLQGGGGLAFSNTDTLPYEPPMVSIKNADYSFAKYETTYDAFVRFLNASKSAADNRDTQGHTLYGSKLFKCIESKQEGFVVSRSCRDYPVTYISWYGAHAYVNWLKKRTGKRYALPSRNQWRNAVAHGQETEHIIEEANFDSGSLFKVGSKLPNHNGIYDLFGNVFEWSSTPVGGEKHAILGGSFRSKRSFLSPTKSGEAYSQNIQRGDLGFRVILYSHKQPDKNASTNLSSTQGE